MDKKELKKSNGDLFFEVERKGKNDYILVNWVGIQSIETIMMGANVLLNMLRQNTCTALLNSNKELIGPWDDGALFLGNRWAIQARNLGLLYFAHVLSPGIYGQRSFAQFEAPAQHHFQIKTFNSEIEAASWLSQESVPRPNRFSFWLP